MNFEEIWDSLQKQRETEGIIELNEKIVVPHSFKNKEYILTHRFKDSTTAFIGHDSEYKKYHIKVFGVPSFDCVKHVYKSLTLIQKELQDFKILPVLEIFEYYENSRWIIFLISEYLEGFTIEELNIAMHSQNFYLSKDSGVSIFLEIVDMIPKLDEKGVRINAMPDNLFVIKSKSPECSVFTSKSSSFDIRVLETSRDWLRCGRSRLEKIYPPSAKRNHIDSVVWGAGLCLYSFVGKSALADLPSLTDLKEDKHEEVFSNLYHKDSAILYILKHSIKLTKTINFAAHPIIVILRSLLDNNWESIENIGIIQIDRILSGIEFESEVSKLLCVRKLLVLGQEKSSDVYKALYSADLLFKFIEICLYFDWHAFPELINSVFLIIKEKSMSKVFKEKLVSMNFLRFVITAIELKVNSDLLCSFVVKFFDDNTLTILQVIWDSGFIQDLLDKPVKSPVEIEFIKDTMSYYGPNSVDFIKKVYETIEISENRVNQHLLEIPYYFKLEKSQLVVQIMRRIIEKNARLQGDSMIDMLKTIVLILGEILCVPKVLQYHHVLGLCTSKSNKLFISDLGRNPLLVKCKQCSHSYCVICISNHPADHDIQYVLYQNPLFRCYTLEPADPVSDISVFRMPKYPPKICFMDSFGTVYKPTATRFIGAPGLSITTSESFSGKNGEGASTVIYFEIKVNQAGIQENISIGIEPCKVFYHSNDGRITVQGKVVGKGPRFGSYDTVGIGITSTNKAYITYNGLVNWPFVECEVLENLKPVVTLHSELSDVEIKLRSWLFQPTDDLSPNQDFINKDVLNISEKLLQLLCKYVKKCFRKNPKDNKAKDLIDKYLEILSAVKRYDLVEKTQVKKSNFWPR